MEKHGLVAAVIVNWNSGNLLRECIQSLRGTAPSVDIVVVDNASTDTSLEIAGNILKNVDIVRNSVNRGFAAAVNQGFAESSNSYVLVLNPDIRVMPGAVEALAGLLDNNPKAGAVSGYTNDKYLPRPFPRAITFMKENLGFSSEKSLERPHERIAVDQPAAAALLIRREAYDSVGGFDERFYPAWYEDVDFCHRLKSGGWEIYFLPDAEFQHEGGYSAATLGTKAFAEAYYHNQIRYAQKHFGPLGQFGVRASIAAGMLIRMAARPGNAGAYAHVFREAIAGWRN
jgi:GT2 family glycosyltransferase